MRVERTLWITEDEQLALDKAMGIIHQMCSETVNPDCDCSGCPFYKICPTRDIDGMDLGDFEATIHAEIRIEGEQDG